MSRTTSSLRLAILLAVTLYANAFALPAAETESGFVAIFNGKNLDGWDGNPKLWSVKDGVIRGETSADDPLKANSFLIWRGGTPADFELRLEFRLRNGNSGVQVRSRDLGNWVCAGYQADILEAKRMGLFYEERKRGILATRGQDVVIDEKGNKKVVGSLGEDAELQKAFKEGEWNEMTIIARGPTITEKVNGVALCRITDHQPGFAATSGVLALQVHVGPPMLVEFKNIRLKNLADAAAAQPSAAASADTIPLFNGKDLTGWAIPEKYDFASHGKVYVKDGVLYLEEGAPMTGIQWTGDFPKTNYEVSLEAMRISGGDFFVGMTFPVGDSHCTWINGGWGGSVVGLSNVDEMNASENMTSTGMSFEDKKWYRFRLRVTDDLIQCFIDDAKVIECERKEHRFSVWEEQSPIKPFGVATWHTGGAIRSFTLKKL
ncbi:MAG: DUF1080 domain-containing protein [Candidatus Sumerlaeia bacterium]|nr:DUF1080 domain-containing protein [Candidatus Sumerlaeia bacterium]